MKKIVRLIFLSAIACCGGSAIAQTLPDKIDAILSRAAVAANTWSVLVESEDGSTIYYQKNPTTGLAPASNTKLFTTGAAFALLGTNYSFQTRVYTNGTLSGGVLAGDLNLVSEHDITWNTSVFSGNARAGLDYIATQLKARGLTTVTGNVQCYGVCYYNLSSTDASSHTSGNQLSYNTNAAVAFRAALQAQGITVSGNAWGRSGFAPPGGLFHTHQSSNLTYGGRPLTLGVACIPLNKVSHNVMADALLRHIGYKLGGVDSAGAGAARVLPWMRNTIGILTNGIVMNDGSGLSWGNRFSARQTVSLLRYMVNNHATFAGTLPIGCVDGTLGGRLCGADGSGRVHAKTGSLSISIALSGYLDNRHDNQRYFFSFIANDQTGANSIDQDASRDAIDDAVILAGARGMLLSPQILQVANYGSNGAVTVKWADDEFIRTGYRVYSSTDGTNFGAPINVAANMQSYTLNGVPSGAKRYFKVSVVNGASESPFSRVYGAQAGNERSKLLIVDGNDRWQFQTTENPQATNHSFCVIAGQSISGPAFDTANHIAVTNGTVSLKNYSSVIWLLGEESTQDRTFDAIEQAVVTSYLNAGGNLFVSGAETGWDLDRDSGPSAADRNFYRNQLRAAMNGNVHDDSATYAFVPLGTGIFNGNTGGSFDNGTQGTFNVDFPDVLTPTNGSVANMVYSGGTGGTAAVQYDGTPAMGKLVNWGFPFETITSKPVRDAYMSDVLRYFGLIPSPLLVHPQFNPAANTMTLTWSSSAGLRYRVQFKNDLADLNWSQVGTDVVATNTTMSMMDMNVMGNAQRFYRVLILN